MAMKFQIKNLAITIEKVKICPTPTACIPTITPPIDAEFQETAVKLLSEALDELRKVEVEQPPGDEE